MKKKSMTSSTKLLIKRKRGYKFKGFDWTELAERWGLCHDTADEALIFERIREALMDAWCQGFTDNQCDLKIVQDVRNFVNALAKDDRRNGYSYPLWAGLSKIKHDETFLKFVYELLPNMWT